MQGYGLRPPSPPHTGSASRILGTGVSFRQHDEAPRCRPDAGRGVRRERPLSVRQEAIMRLIRSWIIEHGEGPTIRQIGASVGLSSTSSVAYQLGQLEKRGLISRTGRAWNSCQLESPKPPRPGLRSR
ncbi:LexA family protein [Streptomyces microflavus]|uniref:LexA family protein n=1 Tax=Streptomyces microflavus TaxID=1919 RepID=UPI0035D6BDBE